MISETLEPFLDASLVMLIWGFVAALWVLAHMVIKDNTWFGNEIVPPGLKDYVIAGSVIVVLCALTSIVFLMTLTLMGV